MDVASSFTALMEGRLDMAAVFCKKRPAPGGTPEESGETPEKKKKKKPR